jgi:hypothetical protein
MMKPIAFILLVLALFPISGTLAAGAASAVTDPATFRWAVKCSTIPTPHIVVCRIVPDLEEGVVRRGPAVPVTFQVDNRDGRLVNIGSELSCRELPVVLRFGDGAPFVVRGSGSLTGSAFDQVIAAFKSSKTGTIEYAPLPDCKMVTATFYYGNLDEALAKARAEVAGEE